MNKHERIMQRKGGMGSRHDRKMEKFSDGFNGNFMFFFLLSRTGLIDFCGERVTVHPTNDRRMTSRHCFRLFEDGRYGQGRKIECCQPNILRHVLMGKKGWGLWRTQWSQGIGQRPFRKEEIMEEFEKKNIRIPDCFMVEFDKAIEKNRREFAW